jgi:two-component system response regulator RpaA
VARVTAVLRRTRVHGAEGLELDRAGRTVRVNGSPLRLSPREYALLACLDDRRGEVVTREELLSTVWGTEDEKALASVTEHVRRVRLAIEPDPRNPRWLRTVRPSGYVLER